MSKTQQTEPKKKPWTKPSLKDYGSVKELTQSGHTVSANDGCTHRARKP
jgi:hypothetical protein